MQKNKAIIIAEAGVNHNGSLELAKQLIDAAATAGADYVKFQTFKSENLVNASAAQADYQIANTGVRESQLDMLKKLELSFDDFRVLKNYCDSKGIKFLSTPFDHESIDFLVSLGIDFMKIPSGEITNLPYLRHIAHVGLPVVMSTGMCSLDDVRAALNALYSGGLTPNQITLLHCNTEYPTPMEDVNLHAMQTLKEEFGVRAGYSDHTQGICIPIAAAALGATVIEKHFTLSRSMSGPDHAASLEPQELKEMVCSIRDVETALGSGIKSITPSEEKNIKVARKSIVAKCHISAGEMFTEDNLTVKRPGTGLSPMLWDMVIGARATVDYEPDQPIGL